MQNARFWEFVNGSWVKLTLKCNQELTWASWNRTDEGYSAEQITWTYVGNRIKLDWIQWGRDCDGRHEYGGRASCYLKHLQKHEQETAPGALPAWKATGDHQRDETAENAGY